jgi:Tol biopolymer transport system component
MKRSKIFFWILATFLVVVFLASFQHALSQESAEELYEAAVFKKESDGDLNGAIQILLRITKEFSGDKKIAGKAQLQIGMCYEKLGKEQAIKAYELVLKNFADQPELVAAARARIAALKIVEPIIPPIEKLPKMLESAAFSRDGTKIAGIDWSVPGQNISVYDYTTNKLISVTHFDWTSEGHGWTYNPIFSPDAKQVAYQFAYHDNRGSELQASTMDGKGRTLYRITKGAILPCDWLPDGSAILMLVKTEGKPWELGLIPSSGGEFKVLRTFDDFRGRSEALPAISPDGRFIIFHEGGEEKSDIKVITRRGEMVGNLTSHPANDYSACWSPDGKYIAFISHRHGNRALWGLEVRDGKPAGKPFLIRPGMRDSGLIEWTSRGIACATFVMTRDIFIMPVDPKSGEPLDEARMLDYTPTGKNSYPQWSPDGRYLAFGSRKKDTPRRGCIVVISPDSGETREYPIPTDYYRGFLTNLRWVPDGSGLGFTMVAPDESSGMEVRMLFRLNIESAEWESWPIPTTHGGTWGPDGATYVFEKRGKKNEFLGIVEWNPSAGKERGIYRIPEDAKLNVIRGMKFSRDSKKLLFSLNNNLLVVLDMETGEAKTVGSDYMSPAWSPDGELVVALDSWEDGWPTTMFVLPSEGGSRTQLNLGNNLPKDYHLLNTDWSPDGKQIVFGTRYTIHEAFLLKNVIPKK